jgi:hypothetical protein
MQGRKNLDGVVILHEAAHKLHTKKLNGAILKLDFEEACNKVKWSFLHQTLMHESRALIHTKAQLLLWYSLTQCLLTGYCI